MNGILIVNKPKGVTSRDVVNQVVKIFETKKVGHTGTLDPLATGVLVICVGSATKLVDELTCKDKEYIASVELGTLTDTLDSEGNVLKEEKVFRTKEEIMNVLNSFVGTYMQEVPMYSAIKINGKKLYEYARNNEEVSIPSREVTINSIELLDDVSSVNDKTLFKFKCNVSKGTYIRSLIRDIALRLNTIGTMTGLTRIKQGIFNIEDALNIEDINSDSLIKISDVLDVKKVDLTEEISKKVLNGAPIKNIYKENSVLFMDKGLEIALYKGDFEELKLHKMFKGGLK